MRKKKKLKKLYVQHLAVLKQDKKCILIQSSQCHEKLHQVVGLTALEMCYGAGFAPTPFILKARFCFTTILKILVTEAPDKNVLLLSFNGSVCNVLGMKDAVIT